MSWWSRLACWILDHGSPVLLVIVGVTLFLGYWSTQVKTDHTAGHFLPAESKTLRDFERASEVFGESQTVLYLVFENADPYDPAFLEALDSFTHEVGSYTGVEQVLSLTNVPYLVREQNVLVSQPLYDAELPPDVLARRLQSQPFLRGLLVSEDGSTAAMLVKIDQDFNDTPERIDLVDRIEAEAERLPGDVALAGFPYLRTQYAKRVTSETPQFTILALLISLAFLFVTFRAWRAVLLPTLIVGLGIVWTIGLMGLFGHRLNIVTAVLPALLVIIGMANTIHLCTKYFDQVRLLGDQREALIHTIQTVGLSTFLACLTTAVGFGVLLLSGSHLLSVFGVFAAAGIMILYGLAITLIPLSLAAWRPPSTTTATLATGRGLTLVFERLAGFTRNHAGLIFTVTGIAIVIGLVGTTRISTDIYVFSDFYESDPLRQDLVVFEEAFGGILPMEVIVESKKPGQFRSLANLRRIEKLQETMTSMEPVGASLALTDLVKMTNQAYFGGHPAAYRLPASYELPFLQSAIKDLLDQNARQNLTRNLPLLVDSTFSITRVFLGVEDIGTTRMNALVDTATARAAALFPDDQFHVFVTGTAVKATRSGESLVKNLLVSLAAALILISILMAALFRSSRLMLISLLPNMLPLLVVGAAMGFGGIILKPSTALIFSIAFGIAVDSSIHFLAKFRLHRKAGLPPDEAVNSTLHQTGKAILFTGLVLTSGFLIFTMSSFGGTVNMGALTALTLGVAMVANLVLLPALLFRYGTQPSASSTSGPVLASRNGVTSEPAGTDLAT